MSVNGLLSDALERIAELESMLVSRTKEVDDGIKRYNKSVSKQQKIIAELEKLINNQIFPSMGDGFSGDYITGYEKALDDMCKALKEQGE